MTEISATIKNLRKKANLTQSDFANAVGVHFQTVSKWERGTSTPDISMLCVIANVLGVTIETLLSVEENSVPIVGDFNAQTLALTITDYRKANGLSQIELAEKVGVSADIVSKWERGITSPDIDALISLSKIFNVAPSILYYGIANNEKPEKKIFYGKKKTKWAVIISSFLAVCCLVLAIISFMLKPNDVETPAPVEYTVTIAGQEYSVLENDWFTLDNLSKNGYTLTKITDENGEEVTFPYKITANKTFNIEYTPINYNINLWVNGGVIEGNVKTTITIEDDTVTLPLPQKLGDNFEGWYLSPTYEGEPILEVTCNYEDINVYAKWSKTVYTINYVLDGGICEENPTTVDINAERTLNTPIKAGYTFLGWYDSKNGGNKYLTVGGANAKNLTLYALWQKEEVKYTVTYNLNGGAVDGINPSEISSGETYKLINPTKTGYNFVGWCDNESGTGDYYVWISGNKNLNLYAIYSPKQYVIRYNFKGVYVDKTNPSYITYGEEVTLNSVTFEGYNFVGWYDAEVGGNKIDVINKNNIDSLSVLYARYNPKTYSINLNGNGGNFVYNQTEHNNYTLNYVYDTTVQLPVCERTKYTFLGWIGSDGNVYEEVNNKTYHFMPFTAKWTLTDGYAINYVLNGGTQVSGFPTHAFSGDNKPLGVAEKYGYDFLGWNDKDDGSGTYYLYTPDTDAEEITLYAIWQEIIVNGSIENFSYEKGATQVTITKYNGGYGDNVDVIFPSYVDGLPVTKIAKNAMIGKRVRFIQLPSELVEFEESAIKVDEVYKPLVIPNTVEILAKECIQGTYDSVLFEEGSKLKVIPSYALNKLSVQDVFILPKGLEELKPYSAPHDVMGIILPNTLKKIGDNAFKNYYDNVGSISVVIPSSVTEIGYYGPNTGFRNEDELYNNNVYIKDGDTVIANLYGKVFSLPIIEKDGYDFIGWQNENGEFINKYFINTENKNVTLQAIYQSKNEYNGREVARPLKITPADDGKTFYLSLKGYNCLYLDDSENNAFYTLEFKHGSLCGKICDINYSGITQFNCQNLGGETITHDKLKPDYYNQILKINFYNMKYWSYAVKVTIHVKTY